MSRDWEQTFRVWSKPSSDTEAARAENAERMIRDAVRESFALKSRNIEVFAQGSYKNNTIVRLDSDVDICVCCSDTVDLDFDFSGGLDMSKVGLIPATYDYWTFKNE